MSQLRQDNDKKLADLHEQMAKKSEELRAKDIVIDQLTKQMESSAKELQMTKAKEASAHVAMQAMTE